MSLLINKNDKDGSLKFSSGLLNTLRQTARLVCGGSQETCGEGRAGRQMATLATTNLEKIRAGEERYLFGQVTTQQGDQEVFWLKAERGKTPGLSWTP